MLKEYFYGVTLLNKEPNQRLLKIKKEADLMSKFNNSRYVKKEKAKNRASLEIKQDLGRE